jgi:hypothetical protein
VIVTAGQQIHAKIKATGLGTKERLPSCGPKERLPLHGKDIFFYKSR